MHISERLKAIQPSVTLSINSKALAMRQEGIDIQSLAVGEPDFPTPEHICEAAKEAIDNRFCRYTAVAGIPKLREACAAYFEREHDVPVSPQSILVGTGGKQCLYNFFQTFLNPSDEVLIPTPYWLSYPDMVLLAGATPVFVRAKAESKFKITVEQLEEHKTNKTKLLVLNSPSNPTGAVLSQDELGAIINWALDNDIFVLSDEIYEKLNYTGQKTASALPFFAKKPEYVAVVNGLSKSFAMTGWRVGFIAAHQDIIQKMTALQGHSTSNICSIAQKAALAALTGPTDFIDTMRETYKKRRDWAHAQIASWKNVVCPKPDGAFYLFADVAALYTDTIKTSTDLCSYLLEKAHVALVPGKAFGDDRCIRFSYAVSDDALHSAVKRVGKCLEELSKQQ